MKTVKGTVLSFSEVLSAGIVRVEGRDMRFPSTAFVAEDYPRFPHAKEVVSVVMQDDGSILGLSGQGCLDLEIDAWHGYDRSKATLAVVAAAEGNGIVLWSVGAHIKMEQEEAGLYFLEDMDLVPPSDGIWIWEGRGVWFPGTWEHPEDGEVALKGKWRRPTDEEWACIHRNECPWNDDEWLLPHVVAAKE
jgi:hypothetical protein